MAIKVIELDLANFETKPLNLKGYDEIQVLGRFDGKPLGYAWIKSPTGLANLTLQEIRLEVLRQLSTELMLTILKKDLKNLNSPVKKPDANLPFITVAVITRNRSQSLELTLQSLKRLNYPTEKKEILIVDNAPNNQLTQKLVGKYPEFHYVVEPRPGLEWGRNRAIREAKGEIIAYTDDDVVLDPGWLLAIGQRFGDPEITGVTGLVVPARQDTEAEIFFEQLGGFGRGFEQRFFSMAWHKIHPAFPFASNVCGTGANMAFRKSALVQLNGFDPVLGAGSLARGGGDLDMFYRMIRAGYLIVYEPQALLWHYHRQDYEGLTKQFQGHGGYYAFLTKIFIYDKAMRWQILAFGVKSYFSDRILNIFKYRGEQRKVIAARAWYSLLGAYRYFKSVKRYKQIITQYGKIELEKEQI
jgi:glycosyltransferase involved in cell wall biosynthesis